MAKREAPWRAQGGTMKAYAQANGLPVDTFYAMKSAHARGLGKSTRARASAAPATFLPVQLAPARGSVRVSVPNGVRMEVLGRLEPDEWRTQVLQGIELVRFL
jgi:hypothetical protein